MDAGKRRGEAKKLVAAAVRWVRGGDQPAGDALGELAKIGSNDLEIYPCNAPAVALFYVVSTQWRISSGMRMRYTGLDYTAIHAALQMQCIPSSEWPRLFDDIRIMESAAISELRIIEQQRDKHGR